MLKRRKTWSDLSCSRNSPCSQCWTVGNIKEILIFLRMCWQFQIVQPTVARIMKAAFIFNLPAEGKSMSKRREAWSDLRFLRHCRFETSPGSEFLIFIWKGWQFQKVQPTVARILKATFISNLQAQGKSMLKSQKSWRDFVILATAVYSTWAF